MSGDSFFSRWSKRKRTGTPALDAKSEGKDRAVADVSAGIVIIHPANTSVDGQHQAKMPEKAGQTGTLPVDTPPVPLPAIASLNPQSDFTPFMGKDVSPALRNQAMKLLFTDPHYNVMDRLDIYIDDYGKPDPLPPDWLRKMNQSKALRLFDEDEVVGKGDKESMVAANSEPKDETTSPVTPPTDPIEAVEETAVPRHPAIVQTDITSNEQALPANVAPSIRLPHE